MTVTTEKCFFSQRGLPRWLSRVNRLALRAALLPVGYSQGLGGGSYSFLLSFRARAFFIPLTFLNALLIPLGRVSPGERRRGVVPRVFSQYTLLRFADSFLFLRRLREFSVVVRRDAP